MKELKKSILAKLFTLEIKLKHNPYWDLAVSDVFKSMNVYNFEELVGMDYTEGQRLIDRFEIK